MSESSSCCKNKNKTLLAPDGTQYWYQYGKLHRNNDKPAIIDANGTKYWHKHNCQYSPLCSEANVVTELNKHKLLTHIIKD